MRSASILIAVAGTILPAACQDAGNVAGPAGDPFPAPAYSLVAGDYCDGATMPAAECAVLVHVYNTTGGDAWNHVSNLWGTDPNPCEWHGVACSGGDHGSVTELLLIDDNLVGTIPPEIGQLSSLTRLRLSANDLGGPIPDALANLQNLVELDLTVNQHTGPLPAWLGDLPDLKYLFLGGNEFSGPIPPQLANAGSLVSLVLNDNALTGAIPEELGGLTQLIEFGAAFNGLSGVVPLAVAALGEAIESCILIANAGGLSVPDIAAYRALDTDGDEEICGLPFASAEDVGEDAVDGIEDLVPDPLGAGQANALTTKIENAMAKAAAGQYQAAINQMQAFIGQLEDMVANGVLTQVQADPFLQQAEALIALWTAQL